MPYSNRMLDDWIESYLEYTDNTEAPYMFRKWSAVAAIAAALQRKCYIKWGTGLTWYPNMYIVLAGPSASRKGTAMDPALEILEEIGRIKIAAQATSLQALIKRMRETNHNDPDMHTGEFQLHSSLTIFSKEFTVFLGYHNQELMSALCDWYDCSRKWSYETISRQKEEIIGVWVNLLGATTPELVRSSMPQDAIGGGLTSRIIYIYEERKGKSVILPMQTNKEVELFKALVDDLDRISLLSGTFRITEQFMNSWADWYISADDNPPFNDPKFAGYLGRRPTHIMKLAMILSVSKNKGKEIMTLESSDFARALETLQEAEQKMTNVFRGLGRSSIAELVQQSIIFFKTSLVSEIPLFQYARHFQDDMGKFEMDRVLATLEAMKLIKVIHRPSGDDVVKVLNN